MPRLLPETQHLPIGVSQETYRTSRRWLFLPLAILAVGVLAVLVVLVLK